MLVFLALILSEVIELWCFAFESVLFSLCAKPRVGVLGPVVEGEQV